MGKKRVSWKNMDQLILDTIEKLREKGFSEPTIRSVYYVLGSEGHIPLTNTYYKSLDEKLVQMRKAKKIPWGFFALKRGTARKATPYISPEDEAEYSVNQVRNAHESYRLPRWFAQEHLVEVWIEKDGLLGVTHNFLRDYDVTVRAPQGYAAWEFVHIAMAEILEVMERQGHEVVHIIYLGDLDPSGKDIPRFMEKEAIPYFEREFGIMVDFQDIGLSPQQVEDNDLPSDPSMLGAEVLAKIRKDSRRKWYLDNYPEMFVELDALYSLATEAARDLVRTTVDQFFDRQTHDETKRREERDKVTVHDLIRERVTFHAEEE